MSWQYQFERARRSNGPVAVDKRHLGAIPPGFEAQGLTINGVWGVYEQNRGIEKIRITELLGKYLVSVSNQATSVNQLTGVNKLPTKKPLQQPGGRPNEGGNAIAGLLALGVGAVGLAALGKAIGNSQKSTAPDPSQAHRVFISHSWAYGEQYQEVKSLLDDAYGFEYFDHSVSSDDPIDAQLPNHLRSKIRDQMRSASVVLVLAGMYVAHSDWIQEEIEMAVEMGKPIIGVVPTENERTPVPVKEHATELVEADGSEILDAIERQA